MLEQDRSRDEMLKSIEVMENRMALLEEENIKLKEENIKIAKFAMGLDREIENVCVYLEKQQNE